MKLLLDHMKDKKVYYERIGKLVQKGLENRPTGKLRVVNCNGNAEYYLITEHGDTNGKYIKKEDREIAVGIAQRDYLKKAEKCAKKWNDWLKTAIETMPKEELKDICIHTKGRKVLIEPIELSDEEYVAKWQSVVYEGKGFDGISSEIYTNRGELVRSKSEKIIADKLNEMGIPYRYEYPFYLKGYGTVYPDFTLLNVNTRKEILLEHLGMMDDQEYSSKALKKIRMYEKNGIFPGGDLIITSETSDMPLNTKVLENMLRYFFV